MNNIKNSTLVTGIDIGSENIYCAIGSLEPENSRIKLLGIGKCSVKESFSKGAITNRNQLIEQLETAVNEAEMLGLISKETAYQLRQKMEVYPEDWSFEQESQLISNQGVG